MRSASFHWGGSRTLVSLVTTLVGLYASLGHAVPSQQYGTHTGTLVIRQDNSTTLADCLTTAGLAISASMSTTWASDIQPWNARVNPVPSALVFPSTEDEVAAALACATQTGTKVTTLGGNRSFSSMGLGRNDGALIINLKNMKVLEYDEATGLLTYGGPVVISEAANYLWNNFSRALPHGRCPDVGMSGIANGGFGTLARLAGTVLDNIVGVRVALANGTIVDADADQHSDLYWAVRGAASSMGVVLQFKIQTLEPPSARVTNYTIAFPSDYTPTQQENVDALLGTQQWAQSEHNADLLSVRFLPTTRSFLEGFFYGTPAEFATVSQSLLQYLPSQMSVSSSEFDFWTSEDIATAGLIAQTLTARRYFYIASVAVQGSVPLDNSTAWQLFSSTVYAPALPDATAGGSIEIWGGEYNKGVAADTSAWRHDDALMIVRWDMRTSGADVSFADSTLETMRNNFYVFVDAYRAAGGVPRALATYRDEKWTIDETAEILYGDNWARLQEVKTAYDPDELFNTDPQAIPALMS